MSKPGAADFSLTLPGFSDVFGGSPRATVVGVVGTTGRVVSRGRPRVGPFPQTQREVPIYECDVCGAEGRLYDECTACSSRNCMRFVRY